jgi:hypothetical protein
MKLKHQIKIVKLIGNHILKIKIEFNIIIIIIIIIIILTINNGYL